MIRHARFSALTLAAVSAVSATACSAAPDPLDADALTAAPSPEADGALEAKPSLRGDGEDAVLGGGWDGSRGRYTAGTCLETSGKTVTAPKIGLLNFERTMGTQKVLTDLGVDVSGQAKFAMLEAKGSFAFARQTEETSGSIVMLSTTELTKGREYMSSYKLTPDALRVIDNPEKFRAFCGDEAIVSVDTGARLMIGVRVSFASESTKKSVEAAVSASSSWAQFKATMSSKSSELRGKTSIAIFATQVGGDVSQITKVLPSGPVACSAEDLAACDKVLTAATDYVRDFNTQFAKFPYASMEFKKEKWTNLPFDVKAASPVPKTVADARDRLGKRLDERIRYKASYDQYSNLPKLMRPSDSDMAELGKALASDTGVLLKASELCWETASRATKDTDASAIDCVNKVNGLGTELKDNETIERWLRLPAPLGPFGNKMIRSRGYSRFCLDMANGRQADGNAIWAWECGASNPNQRWSFSEDGKVRDPGARCLDIAGGSQPKIEYTKVWSWGCVQSATDPWTFDGRGHIVNGNGMCLTMPSGGNGVQAVVSTCSEDPGQLFDVVQNP